MSLGVTIIFGGVWDLYENIYKSIVKNKINFMYLLTPTNHRQICPFGRFPHMIWNVLFCIYDTGNNVLFRIIYHEFHLPPRRGSHVKSDNTQSSRTNLSFDFQ